MVANHTMRRFYIQPPDRAAHFELRTAREAGPLRIGFIGLGNMGGPMALNLVKAGAHEVCIYDVRRAAAAAHLEAGATWAESPRAAAAQCELLMTSLPGPPEVEQVVNGEDGIAHSLRPGSIYVDLSTNSPSLVRRIAGALKEKGVDVLDAPVSGGAVGAKAASLTIMVGGDEAIFRKVLPVFETIGAKDQIIHVGAIGAGNVAKLAHNQLCMVTSAAIAEAFTMGVKAGVAPDALFKVVSGGAFGRGMLLQGLPAVVFKGNFDRPATFALKLAHKDLALATELGREFQVPMPLAALVEQELTEALVRGMGDKDGVAAFALQEERAGVKVRTR
jgi:3-hydroxyisobutyrate dehydrogenase-like beta-hydroxyacid dehydrogenase